MRVRTPRAPGAGSGSTRSFVDRRPLHAAVLAAALLIAGCRGTAEPSAGDPAAQDAATLGILTAIRSAGSAILTDLQLTTVGTDGSAARHVGTLPDTRFENGGVRAVAWSRAHDRFAQVSGAGIQVTTGLTGAGAQRRFTIPILEGSVPAQLRGYVVHDVAWSPDGRRLAAAIGRRGSVTASTVVTFPADSGVDVDVFGNERPGFTTAYVGPNDFPGVLDVAWSARGDSLLLAISGRSEGPSGIYAVSSSGSGLRLVVRPVGDRRIGQPAWSPDARSIAFVETRQEPGAGERSVIIVVGADGTAPQLVGVPSSDASDVRPTWRGIGRELAFVRIRHAAGSGADADSVGVLLAPGGSGAARAVPLPPSTTSGEGFAGIVDLSW